MRSEVASAASKAPETLGSSHHALLPVVGRHVLDLLELLADVRELLVHALLLHLLVGRIAHVLDKDVQPAHARGRHRVPRPSDAPEARATELAPSDDRREAVCRGATEKGESVRLVDVTRATTGVFGTHRKDKSVWLPLRAARGVISRGGARVPVSEERDERDARAAAAPRLRGRASPGTRATSVRRRGAPSDFARDPSL